MKKAAILCAALLFLACSGSFSAAHGAEQSPEALVHEFYAWYMREMEKDLPKTTEYNDVMYKYVYPCTVNKLRIDHEQGARDADYFLAGQDFVYEEDAKNYYVHPAVRVTETLSLVPVGARLTENAVPGEVGKPFLLVFVQKTREGWRIIKVERKYFDYY